MNLPQICSSVHPLVVNWKTKNQYFNKTAIEISNRNQCKPHYNNNRTRQKPNTFEPPEFMKEERYFPNIGVMLRNLIPFHHVVTLSHFRPIVYLASYLAYSIGSMLVIVVRI
ncbi:hypothetical protein T09_12330 [Trichinella sp. T9]|nr:hypothetical protein T09_12330 [Trichinella sp. T9]